MLREAGSTSLKVSTSESERLRFWSGRRNAFPAVGRLAPDYYCMDGTIPRRRRLPEVLQRIGALSQEFALPIANVFHAGDGNLHPLIMFDAGKPDELERAEHCGNRILELCVAVGGTVTGEHGVGVEKLGPMCIQFGSAELQMFHAVKRAFDPLTLLNPGKAVPTLARCADYGALRVQGGQLPFAHLPRFLTRRNATQPPSSQPASRRQRPRARPCSSAAPDQSGSTGAQCAASLWRCRHTRESSITIRRSWC